MYLCGVPSPHKSISWWVGKERVSSLTIVQAVHTRCFSLSVVCTLSLCMSLALCLPHCLHCLVQRYHLRSFRESHEGSVPFPLSASCLCLPMLLTQGYCLCSPPPSAKVSHFLPPGGQPGQEPAFPAFLHSELSACGPHLHPSPS